MMQHPSICPKCGSVSDTDASQQLECLSCHFTIPRKDYEKIIEFGSDVVLFRVYYRRKYENDLKKYGKLPSRYSLPEPTTVLSCVAGAIAGGILGNAAYDSVKYCLRGIANALKNKDVSPVSVSKKKPFASAEDLDLIYRLLGQDDECAHQFLEDIKDYLNGMPKAHPDVRNVIIGKETIHKAISAARSSLRKLPFESRHQYVYVTESGRCYHVYGCSHLRGNIRRISLAKARKRYVSCGACRGDGA